MNLRHQSRFALLTGTLMLALAVLIGAFGAHGLKNLVAPEKLVTFEIGVRYHFYHGFALLFLGLINQVYELKKFTLLWATFFIGILLFSFNCYFYVLLDMKVFAMIVPLGGLLFTLGWIVLFWEILKAR